MAPKLTQYHKAEQRFLEEKIKERMALVKTEVMHNGQLNTIVYTMVLQDSGWLLFDVNVDGASMIRTTMAQGRRALRDGGFEGVMEALERMIEQSAADQ